MKSQSVLLTSMLVQMKNTFARNMYKLCLLIMPVFATIMLIDYAKQQGAKKITIRINKKNAASNRIAQKLGFAIIGEKTYTKKGTTLSYTDFRYELNIAL